MNTITSREEALFKAALELGTAEERAALLDRECGDDAALRAEVESLLAAMDDAGTKFLGAPAVISASAATILYQRGEGSLPTSGSRSMFSGSVSLPPGSYTVGDEIAHGGMGTVLEVEDRELGRKVAMKVMRLEASASEQARARFVREATVLARLEHPNIVPIHELGRDEEGRLYYTMKLVIGRTLQAVIKGLHVRDPHYIEHYTLDRLLIIFRKVCDALAFAHAKGVLHRDLKPENIMVGEFGEVLVMDWGLAKILHEEEEGADASRPPIDLQHSTFLTEEERLAQTMAGAVMGTPQYMSPEQALGQLEQLDERSDIYSLGGILYALLTLRPPVEGKTLEEVLEKVRTGEVVSPSHFGATAPSGKKSAKGEVLEAKKIKPLPHIESGRVPAALSSVVMKALTLDKAARYQSVPEFAADIEKYQTGFATTAEEAGLFTQLRLLVQRHRREFAVGFAAWLIITTLAVWFVFNLRAKEQRATQAEALAVQEKETARQALAKSQLDLAEKEFERGKFVEAQKIIGETPESFRDANWRFLHAHSRDFTSRIRERNAGPVHRIQFFPQGDRFAVKCYRGSLGKEALGIFTLESKRIGDWIPVFGEASKSDAVGIDGTGDRISFAASAKEIAVQEVATGRALRRWTCEEEVSHVLLSPDGGTVLAVVGNQVIAYATETGAQRWMHPSTGAIPDISPDGRTVAVLAFKSGLDFKVQILDTVSGDVHRSIEGASNRPIGPASLQFSRVGNRLACFHGDEITYWNASDGARFRTHLFPGETVGALSPSGDVVATFSGNSISLWDSTTGQLLRSLNGSTLDVMNLAFSPDGKWILSSHDSAENLLVQVWPTRLGEEVVSVRENAKAARWVAFNHDGSEFYTGGQDSGAWGTHTGLQKCKFPTGRLFARGLAVHPTDGSILLSELDKKTITHLSSAGEVMGAFGGIQHNSSVTFSHNGQLVLSVASATSPTNAGYAFSVQEYPSGKELRKVTFEKPGQPFAAFCLDDAVVATAALTGGITVWDWKAGKPLRQIDAAQTGSIACLASSPDSRHLASGGPDRWIRVWEAATGRMEAAFRAHWEGVRCVKFSPDGSEILSGSEDGTVRIHDAASGEERLALYGLTTPVADVDLSADGKLIAAISKEDGVAKVWDRQRSSTAALLGQGVITKEPVAAQDVSKRDTPSAPAKKPKPTVPNAPAVAVKGVPDPATASADALIAAGRTSEAIPLLEKASISQPGDAILAVRLAALQAWFGMDAELAATRQRMLDWAPTATDPESVRHFARVACLRPLADESQRQATLATARLAVEKGNNPVTEPMRRLTLGMAEYRSGHYLAADAALNAAVQAAPVNPAKVMIEGTANYYRVMSLFHQGKTDEARTLFAETEAKMPRLPADEKNPLATVSGQEKLILWLACKEAKALLAEPYTTPK